MKTIPQIRKKGKSKRNRCRGRQLTTFNNKLSKLKSQYNHLFKTSQSSKMIYLGLSEEERKPKNKVFFCDKYPDFQNFLAVNKLRPVGRDEPNTVKTVSKPKNQVWGR